MLAKNIDINKIDRLVNTCPNCNSMVYYKKNEEYICHQCKNSFHKPVLVTDTNILDYNYYINALPIQGGLLYLDGLSFGLLEKLNIILEKNGSFVNIDFKGLQAKLKLFKDTESEFSKIQLLKIREDYLDHEEMYFNLLKVLEENKESPLSSDTFDVSVKAPVFMKVPDIYDLEQLSYDLAKDNKDGEIEALLDMFNSINKAMIEKRS